MLFLVFILSYIAYSDITKRKIYNKSIVFLLFITLWLNFIFPRAWSVELFSNIFLSFCIYFSLFLIFYVLKWMGAGDVKLGGALAILFGVNNFFVVWMISVLMLVVYVSLVKVFYIFGVEGLRRKFTFNDIGEKYIPYGAMLCFASLILIFKMEAGFD